MSDSDRERLDWLEQARAQVGYSDVLPDGTVTPKPWRVVAPGRNPIRGQTLREAIDAARRKGARQA